MKKIILLIGIIILIIPLAFALKYYDEFTDDEEVIIKEVVLDTAGISCSGCSANLTLSNPDGSFNQTGFMTYNTSTSTFDYNLSYLIIGVYPIKINANDSSFNGTSDRVYISVYDFFPEISTDWEFGIMFLISGIAIIFLYISRKLSKEHQPIKLLFLGSTLFVLLLDVSLILNVVEDSVTGTQLTNIETINIAIYKGLLYLSVLVIVVFLLSFTIKIINHFYEMKEGYYHD